MVNHHSKSKEVQTHSWRYRLIAKRLREGVVLAYPTEGVWGLGCLPEDQSSVEKILSLKGRSWRKGLILVGSSLEQLVPYIDEITQSERRLLASVWPGPVTFLVPKSKLTPIWISGDSDHVAIRVSAHSVVQGICSEVRQPIVSTSANPAGKPPAKNKLRLKQYFGDSIDEIVPGSLGGEPGPSEIRYLRGSTLLRQSTSVRESTKPVSQENDQ